MRHRNRRLATIAAAGAVLVAAVALGLFALRDALVAEGSVGDADNDGFVFVITDGAESVDVTYFGILPDLFREGQGVVAEGRMTQDGRFAAETVLAKHDETYMPPEVAEALREAGTWQGEEDEPGSR